MKYDIKNFKSASIFDDFDDRTNIIKLTNNDIKYCCHIRVIFFPH